MCLTSEARTAAWRAFLGVMMISAQFPCNSPKPPDSHRPCSTQYSAGPRQPCGLNRPHNLNYIEPHLLFELLEERRVELPPRKDLHEMSNSRALPTRTAADSARQGSSLTKPAQYMYIYICIYHMMLYDMLLPYTYITYICLVLALPIYI